MASAVCQTATDLVEQMEKTCGYKVKEATYANAAVLMIQGALDYVSPNTKVVECLADKGGVEGKNFKTEYGHLLSKETKEFLAIA